MKSLSRYDRPAYVVEARHGALTGITLGSMVRGIAERGMVWNPLKRQRQREIHPPEKILECAKREWDDWRKTLTELGYTDTPEYPYSLEKLNEFADAEAAEAAKRFG